jgi:hypothetical protein
MRLYDISNRWARAISYSQGYVPGPIDRGRGGLLVEGKSVAVVGSQDKKVDEAQLDRFGTLRSKAESRGSGFSVSGRGRERWVVPVHVMIA